jgi:hypothetical protein
VQSTYPRLFVFPEDSGSVVGVAAYKRYLELDKDPAIDVVSKLK